jgi:hypothetical protein
VVLIDDVCTVGGHLQACAAVLRRKGYIAGYAVCGGRTMHEQQPNPFSIGSITLLDFYPEASAFPF